MSDEECECEECEAGAPAWLATFADLMSLLMCFFVLLLSFSEMDIQKYKQVAGSMKSAFGIQRQIKADQIPKGTSVIKQEFTPGKPEPTLIKRVEQTTPDDSEQTISQPIPQPIPPPIAPTDAIEELVRRIEYELYEEIEAEVLEIFISESGVMIRVREQDAFPSGSAELQAGFKPVLDKLVSVLNESTGRIVVSGHTDDVPIANDLYASNWMLSSARAASVVHYFDIQQLVDSSRVELRAFADTQPVVNNSSDSNRARNRRVEINIILPNAEDI